MRFGAASGDGQALLTRAEPSEPRLIRLLRPWRAGTSDNGPSLSWLGSRPSFPRILELRRPSSKPEFDQFIDGALAEGAKPSTEGTKTRRENVFYGHEDDPENVSLVVDVLDMWNFLERGYEELSEEGKARVEREAEFFGKRVRYTNSGGSRGSKGAS